MTEFKVGDRVRYVGLDYRQPGCNGGPGLDRHHEGTVTRVAVNPRLPWPIYVDFDKPHELGYDGDAPCSIRELEKLED